MIKILFLFTLFSSQLLANDSSIENKIVCPKISEYYISNSKKTLMAMKDLIGSLVEVRETDDDLVLSLIELSKSKVFEERSGGIKKINEVKQALIDKQKRAKENYNEQLKILANYSSKIKKCWSFLTPDQKKEVGEYINKFQQNKILSNYKTCIGSITNTNNLYSNKYIQTYNYYNGKITAQSLEGEHSIINKNIAKSQAEEFKQCISILEMDKSKQMKEIEKMLKEDKGYNPRGFMKGF